MNKDEILGLVGACLAIIVGCIIFRGISVQCQQWFDQGKAEWQQKMDFAKNAGGVYEPLSDQVVFPDGRILRLGGNLK